MHHPQSPAASEGGRSSTGGGSSMKLMNPHWQSSSSFSIGRKSFFRRHDSFYSVATDYKYSSPNDLTMLQGAALLAADCLGTGILALPHDIHVLGVWFGVGFLILNLPINLYAGTILSDAALFVEHKQKSANDFQQYNNNHDNNNNNHNVPPPVTSIVASASEGDLLSTGSSPRHESAHFGERSYDTMSYRDDLTVTVHDVEDGDDLKHQLLHHDTATFDFIGMTSALFPPSFATGWVMLLFYTNIFLVLGDYILVMSHAVAAVLGENWVCIPVAGLLASTLMFAVSQLRTMANLGRTATVVSLTALVLVVVQCIYFATIDSDDQQYNDDNNIDNNGKEYTIMQKLSAMGSIGFAVGSQKLFLNIRHEIGDRESAPKSLAIALTAYGTLYVIVVLCSGSNPPGFLFDSIPSGVNRRIAGFLLWIHVVVSYAINSQAICASMDRIFFYRWGPVRGMKDHHRWMILTGIMAVSAFFVANAIPFFKDLVALIGALTSVPLTLLLPAIYHRKVLGFPLWLPTMASIVSYALVVFAVLFMIAAMIGSVDSIFSDWEHHKGGFFACN